MDVYCPVCGEPWDADCLHDAAAEATGEPYYLPNPDRLWSLPHGTLGKLSIAQTPNPNYSSEKHAEAWERVRADFFRRGCIALEPAYPGASSACKPRPSMRTELTSALADILGDDIDGIASELADAEYLGFLDG